VAAECAVPGGVVQAKKEALRVVHVASGTVFPNWPTSGTPLHHVYSADISPSSSALAIGNDRGKVRCCVGGLICCTFDCFWLFSNRHRLTLFAKWQESGVGGSDQTFDGFGSGSVAFEDENVTAARCLLSVLMSPRVRLQVLLYRLKHYS
jgi:hypothetical protein